MTLRIQSGPEKGKTAEELLLKKPSKADFIRSSSNSVLAGELNRLVSKLDAKDLVSTCHECKQPATRYSIYYNNHNCMFWCDDCDPYTSGAVQGKLTIGRTFDQAITHIDLTANGKKSFKDSVIKEIAVAKGLPKRVGEAQALAFFA